MKRILHALAALWLGKTEDRSRETEDRGAKTEDRRAETEERGRKAEDRWKTEERRREHEGPWLPEARNGLLQHLTAMMRMGETVRELATRECAHLPIRESANEQLSESANVQTNESVLEKADDHLPKRVIVSEREQPAERIGEPLPIAQVLARLYLRHAPRCAMGEADEKAVPAEQPGSPSSDSAKPNSQPLSLASGLIVPLVSWVLALFMCLLSAQQVSAQAEPAAAAVIQPLQIGDAIPEELWHLPLQVVNQPPAGGKETITLNDYRGKLIILDFWATWCAPCITSMYKLDTLQSQFAGELAVIPTTYEHPEKVAPFFAEKGWALPTVVSQTQLKAYFPHRSIPHQVWLKDEKIYAIPLLEYTSAQTIASVIKKEQVDLRMNEFVPLDRSKPLFLEGNGGNGNELLYYSAVSGRIKPRVGGGGFRSTAPGNKAIFVNMAPDHLYLYAFSSEVGLDHRRVIWETSDSLYHCIKGTSIARPTGDALKDAPFHKWVAENSFCYNLFSTYEMDRATVKNIMKSDLNNHFNLYYGIFADVQNRTIKCLVVRKIDSAAIPSSIGGEQVVELKDSDRYHCVNAPLAPMLSNMLAKVEPQAFLVDSTYHEERVDLTLPKTIDGDFNKAQEELGRYGLRLFWEDVDMDVVIIKETN